MDDNKDYESFVEETPEDGQRINEELDQDDDYENYEIIPTDQDQSTSKEDDCFVGSEQSASEEEVKERTLCPKRSYKTLSNYNPQTCKSYAQRNVKTTGVVKTNLSQQENF